jgi:formylglycine-generating enzyme required for sulfatase activity
MYRGDSVTTFEPTILKTADEPQQYEIQDSTAPQFQFVPVPAGTAVLGIEDAVAERFIKAYGLDTWGAFFRRETPQHTVEITAFGLARYPVTNVQYAQFIAEGGYTNADYWTPDGWAWIKRTNRTAPLRWGQVEAHKGDNVPVVGVSWYEAQAFARWASIRTGLNVRLPNEAEWEWAARGLNTRSLYPWGGAWDASKLNSGHKDDSTIPQGRPVEVGSYSPAGDGPFGHSDQLGQVWEWTNSLYAPYPFFANDGREDRYSSERRIMRGGNWADGKYVNRVTARYMYPPFYSDKTTGFRVAVGGSAPAITPRPVYDLVVYGRTTFCPDLMRLQSWLVAWNVPYRQVNVDMDEEAAIRLDDWLGNRVIPTLVVAQRGELTPISEPAPADLSRLRSTDRGSMLHEPDEATLRAFLVRNGFLAE